MILRSGRVYRPNVIKKKSLKINSICDKEYIKKVSKIDFDEASKEWRKNKVYLGSGMFIYKSDDFNSYPQ